jgi:diguanylate cyclase (GGDEF)-like protein
MGRRVQRPSRPPEWRRQGAAPDGDADEERGPDQSVSGERYASLAESTERLLGENNHRGVFVRARLVAASARDATADARDLAALARDRAAVARDLAMTRHDDADAGADGRAQQRSMAAEDRLAAANDREHAGDERLRASADRELLASELAVAETDPLTGARTRAAGLADFDRELDRCRRTGSGLVVGYVDVLGLPGLDDPAGDTGGDELLRHVAALLRTHLRPYDLMVRLARDEFLCAIPDMSEADARERFAAVGGALAGRADPCRIRSGFATLRDDETAIEVIARADAELIRPPAPDLSD